MEWAYIQKNCWLELYCHSSFYNSMRPFDNSSVCCNFYNIICHFCFHFLEKSFLFFEWSLFLWKPDFLQMMGQGMGSSSGQIDSCRGTCLNHLSWLPKIHVSTPSPPPPPTLLLSGLLPNVSPCSWNVQLWFLAGVVECLFRAEQPTFQSEFVLSRQSTSSSQEGQSPSCLQS